MTFLPFWYIAMWETPGEFRKAYFPGPPSYRVSPRRCNRRSLADPPRVRRLFPPDRRRRGGDGAGGHRASRGGVSCTPLILRSRLSAIPPLRSVDALQNASAIAAPIRVRLLCGTGTRAAWPRGFFRALAASHSVSQKSPNFGQKGTALHKTKSGGLRRAARSRSVNLLGYALMSVERDSASWSRISLSRASTAGMTIARPSLPPTNTCGGFAMRVRPTRASPSLSGLPVCLPS
jgi:hypothetical protein